MELNLLFILPCPMKEVEPKATAQTRVPRPPTEAHLSDFTQEEQSLLSYAPVALPQISTSPSK